MTPILWGAFVVALLVAPAAWVFAGRRRGRPWAAALLAVGVVGVVAGGLGWGAWMSAADVTARIVAVNGTTCDVAWTDGVTGAPRRASVDCVGDPEPDTDVRVKAHHGPLAGGATAHGGRVRDLVLGWVPGIGTVLVVTGGLPASRRSRA